jgi:hypothetical protein
MLLLHSTTHDPFNIWMRRISAHHDAKAKECFSDFPAGVTMLLGGLVIEEEGDNFVEWIAGCIWGAHQSIDLDGAAGVLSILLQMMLDYMSRSLHAGEVMAIKDLPVLSSSVCM